MRTLPARTYTDCLRQLSNHVAHSAQFASLVAGTACAQQREVFRGQVCLKSALFTNEHQTAFTVTVVPVASQTPLVDSSVSVSLNLMQSGNVVPKFFDQTAS